MLAALTVTLLSLWVSHALIADLEREEYHSMEIWASAMKSLNNADPNTDMTLVLKILGENQSIPVIVTDAQGQLIESRNLPSSLTADNDILKEAKVMQQAGRTLRIDLTTDNTDTAAKDSYITISWGESLMLRRLALYPYVQLGVLAILAAVAIYALLSAKRAEQNKVWVGLSRETAHQLGTPISSLTAWHQLLLSNYPDEPLLSLMEGDLARLGLIAERFSKIGSTPELTPQEIKEVIERTISYISLRTSDKVRMQGSYPSDETKARINAPLFEWVIENLCKNAIDAMSGEGRIDIFVYRNGGKLAIEVTDTGRGIPPSHVRDVFRPGYTTKKRGWGLGLSLARRIIEQYHKGRIYVKRSEVGVGTTFCIELPL